MVDHEISTKENFSLHKNIFLDHDCSANEEDFRRIMETDYITHIELFRKNISSLAGNLSTQKKVDHIRSRDRDLSCIVSELLSLSSVAYKSTEAAQRIKYFEKAYKSDMEKFLFKMDEFMLSAYKMSQRLIKSLQEHQTLSRGTAYVILGSSVANVAVLISSLMRKIFHFPLNPRMLLIPTVTGALTFTTSLMTFTYMKHATNDFSNDLRKEARLLKDLIAAHHKGDWLDEEVAKLFPYGIDKNLIDFEDVSYFKTKYDWKKYLCSKIILSSIESDKKLLKNEDFLIKVKLFVENPAAEIWWSRMKIKKVMEEIRQKANDETSSKQFLSFHEDLIYRTALYVYPVLIPWLVISRTSEEMRLIFTTVGGFFAALEVRNDGSEELKKLKKMYLSFEKDFKDIYKICEILDEA